MEDRDDRLEEATHIKQTGNVLYKSGKFKDALRYYTQVLDLLTSQTSLTGEKKEKRDNLVLTSHLNLAACELKLGDNDKVIEHCSLVLQMDKDSFKAYARRGQAYHKNRDYHLALKDYLEAGRLDPQNAEVGKLIENLRTDMMILSAGLGAMKMSEGASVAGSSGNVHQMGAVGREECPENEDDQEYHELEVTSEGDDEAAIFRARHKSCPKAARHPEYIPVFEFSVKNLPAPYNTPEMVALVKHLVDLTVILRVVGSSYKRPKYIHGTKKKYPFSGPGHKDSRRWGSGRVKAVLIYPEMGNEECPCPTCQSSGKPRKEFAKVCIETAAHVIYDLYEAKDSVAFFNYDTDQTQLGSCPLLHTAVEISCSDQNDVNVVTFITHDLNFANVLSDIQISYLVLNEKMKTKFGVIDCGDSDELLLELKCTHLYEQFQEVLLKWKEIIEYVKDIMKGDARQLLAEHLSKNPGNPSPFYLRFLSEKVRDSGSCENDLHFLTQMHDKLYSIQGLVRTLKDNYTEQFEQFGYQGVLQQYQLYRSVLNTGKRYLQCPKFCLDKISVGDENEDQQGEKKFYNSSHPLTIIVSHPHGLPKKISIGEVTKRSISGERDELASYVYSNTTCPGSSGAPVYIMGKVGTVNGTHPHSKMVQFLSNKSAITHDW